MDEMHTQTVNQLKPLLKQVLSILGENPEREGLLKTPERWAEALVTYTAGTHQDPHVHLQTSFEIEENIDLPLSDDMVMINNIEFVSTCEHHMASIQGVAHVAYIPNAKTAKVVGLSKISRVVNLFARRLQMQERLTQEIADAIHTCLSPQGVMVMIQAIHFCMIQRGVEQHASTTITTARRGLFLEDPQLEAKFQSYIDMRKGSGIWRN